VIYFNYLNILEFGSQQQSYIIKLKSFYSVRLGQSCEQDYAGCANLFEP